MSRVDTDSKACINASMNEDMMVMDVSDEQEGATKKLDSITNTTRGMWNTMLLLFIGAILLFGGANLYRLRTTPSDHPQRPHLIPTDVVKGSITSRITSIRESVAVGGGFDVIRSSTGSNIKSDAHHHHHMVVVRVPSSANIGEVAHVRSQRVIDHTPTSTTTSKNATLTSFRLLQSTHSELPVLCSAMQALHIGDTTTTTPPTTTTTTTPPTPSVSTSSTPIWRGIQAYIKSKGLHLQAKKVYSTVDADLMDDLDEKDDTDLIIKSIQRDDGDDAPTCEEDGGVVDASSYVIYGSLREEAVVRAYMDRAVFILTYRLTLIHTDVPEEDIPSSGLHGQHQGSDKKMARRAVSGVFIQKLSTELVGVVRELVREFPATLITTFPLFVIPKTAVAQHALTFYDDSKPTTTHDHDHHDHPQEVRNFVDLHLVVPGHVDELFIMGPSTSSPRSVLHSQFNISDGQGAITPIQQRSPFRPAARGDIAPDSSSSPSPSSNATYTVNRRTTAEEMEARSISVTTHQQVAPGKQTRAITFLSGGYTLEQKASFEAKVASAISILRTRSTNTGGVLTGNSYGPSPWDTYFSLLNVYSVFEKSEQSGASRPHGPGYSCGAGMSNCGPSSVNNNLECSFGTPQPSRLSCSYELSKALASFAPAMDIIIVLVNEEDYGGTGSLNFASLTTNSDNLPFLLLHEVGHAVGNLGDEYSYGYSDPVGGNTYNLPNCATTDDATAVQWSQYITAGLVDATPSQGCSYDNYYRPTNEKKCIMKDQLAPEMCPVCKDAMVTQLFGGDTAVARTATTTSTSVYVDMTAPHCPHPAFHIYLAATDITTLTLNHRFILYNDNVTVRWSMPDGSTLEGSPSAKILGSTLKQRTTLVTATITDNTALVRRGSGGVRPPTMTQTITYTILLKTAADTCGSTPYTCTASTGVEYTYCGTCTASATDDDRGDCSQNSTVISLYNAIITSDLTDEDAQKALVSAVVVMVVVAVVVVIVAIGVSCIRTQNNPQPVFEESTCNKATWVLAMVTSLLVVVAVILLVAFFVGYIEQLTVFGAGLFVGLLVIAIFVYVIALLLFSAAAFRLSILSIICSIVMIIFAMCMFAMSVAALHLVVNRETDSVVEVFAEQWQKQAREHPDRICSLQNFLSCSGYYYGCVPTPNAYCPENCDIGNRDPDACLPEWQSFAYDRVLPASIVGVIIGFAMLLAAVCGIVYCALSRREAASAAGRRSYRNDPRAPVKPLTAAELTALKREFKKADADGTGELEGEEVLHFINSVFPEDRVAMTEAQDFIDRNDPMSFEDVVDTYFPYLRKGRRGVGTDPRLLTPEEAERAGDPVELQRLQFAKLDQFTSAAGRLSPEALYNIFQAFLHNNHTSQKSPATRRRLVEEKKKARIQDMKKKKMNSRKKMSGRIADDYSDDGNDNNGNADEDEDEYDALADQELFDAPSADNSTVRGVSSTLSSQDTEALLRVVRKEAQSYASTEPYRMLDGLTLYEIEGLRGAWVSLRPMVSGPLSDEEIDQMFQWTHGATLTSHEHFVRWKETLDVRGTGKIHWEEFCVPFAQRARLRSSEVLLKSHGKEVIVNTPADEDDNDQYYDDQYSNPNHIASPSNADFRSPNPRLHSSFSPPTSPSRRGGGGGAKPSSSMVTRRQVLDNYDAELVSAVFAPFEDTVPAQRVAAAYLARTTSPSNARMGPRTPMSGSRRVGH